MSIKQKIKIVIDEAVLTNTFTVNTMRQLFDDMDVVTKQQFEEEMTVDEVIEFAWVCDSVGYVYGEIVCDVSDSEPKPEPKPEPEPEPVATQTAPKFLGIF